MTDRNASDAISWGEWLRWIFRDRTFERLAARQQWEQEQTNKAECRTSGLLSRFDPEKHRHTPMLDDEQTGRETR